MKSPAKKTAFYLKCICVVVYFCYRAPLANVLAASFSPFAFAYAPRN
ncbi:MAG: hypothetical protein JSC189_001009 [Candidatus Tokpelaia sp. JSC189]|nr:MAG: hypothetical protein JSC189_001009 [Candidatus Tokpelaia sp. JSC189]